MKRIMMSAAVLALLATGCQNEVLVEQSQPQEGQLFTLEVGRGFESRTVLGETDANGITPTWWSEDDAIYVSGADGKVSGVLKFVGYGQNKSIATFSGYVTGGQPSKLEHIVFPVPEGGKTIDMSARTPGKLDAPMIGTIVSSAVQTLNNVGGLIAFKSDKPYDVRVMKDGENWAAGSYTFDPTTGKLTYTPGDGSDLTPTYNPDNSELVYVPVATTDKPNDGSSTEKLNDVTVEVLENGAVISNATIDVNPNEIVGDEDNESTLPTISAWDGEAVDISWYKEEVSEFEINTAAQFAGLAKLVNEGKNLENKTIKLDANINLNNHQWTPIGISTSFKGTFNGDGHIISNLTIQEQKDDLGLFCNIRDAVVKNLTIMNATITGTNYLGIVAGNLFQSELQNIMIQGHVEVQGADNVGGVVGYVQTNDGNESKLSDLTINTDDTSFVEGRRKVGGIVGNIFSNNINYSGYNGHVIFDKINSNMNVSGSEYYIGGIVGSTGHDTQLSDCSVSGKIVISNAKNTSDASTIGGIAGVWRNFSTEDHVILNDCNFSGTIETNIEFTYRRYGALVGSSEYEKNSGKISINGQEYTPFDDFTNINELLKQGLEYTFTNHLYGLTNTTNGYGATGLYIDGGVLNGGGYELWVSTKDDWDSAIAIETGTIKNINIRKGFRGVFVKNNDQKVILNNIVIDGTGYTISCDKGLNGGLEATDCTFNGWTSYAASIGNVKFTNCYFGYGNGDAYCRPYATTDFINCEFEKGYKIDLEANCTFENCTFDGVDLTAENLSKLVNDISKATLK